MRAPSQHPPLDQCLILEIDGPGANPENADAPSVLEFAAAFFQLVRANANEMGELSFTNLQIIDKCLAVIALPDSLDLAKMCADEAVKQIAHGDPPRGAGIYVERARTAINHLPAEQHAKVLIGSWHRDVVFEPNPTPEPLDSVLSIRATPIRVGGSKPAVRFRSDIEEEFTLSTTQDVARRIAQHLYREVEIDANVRRDAEGTIINGRLDSFEPVLDGDPRSAWVEWFHSVGGNELATEEHVERYR